MAFKRSSVSKEEHKGRWCQRGELENDEERERERHGDESKGVDVGNQPVVEEEGRGGYSKRPRESERGGLVARGRREVVEEGGEEREREREMGSGGRMVKARMKEREEPWSKKGTHKGPLVN